MIVLLPACVKLSLMEKPLDDGSLLQRPVCATLAAEKIFTKRASLRCSLSGPLALREERGMPALIVCRHLLL